MSAISSDLNNQMLSLIAAKREGKEHRAADIYWLVNYLDKIPDYQLSAWLMAVCLRGLSSEETVELTRAMAFSGHVLTLQRHAECDDHEHSEQGGCAHHHGQEVYTHKHDASCEHGHHDAVHKHDASCGHGHLEHKPDDVCEQGLERGQGFSSQFGLKAQAFKKYHGFVDKHSTGGVGDKTSLVLSPLLAALGFKVSKFSGRALGHTGGTIDKLEAIPGFRTDISMKEFEKQIETVGVALAAQTEEFAPADKRLYALRDKSGTVESIPLIAASVMSKKIAGGADHIILDVKVGSGAFMKNIADAKKLARAMKDIGKSLKLNVQVLLTDMDQPLGATAGNALEVLEAISVLKGYKNFESYIAERASLIGLQRDTRIVGDGAEQGVSRNSPNGSNASQRSNNAPSDFYELCIELASTIADRKDVIAALESGAAFQKFIEFVRAQSDADKQLDLEAALTKRTLQLDLLGQDLDVFVGLSNQAALSELVCFEELMVAELAKAKSQDYYVSGIDAYKLGIAVHKLAYTSRTAELVAAGSFAQNKSAYRINDNYVIDNSAGLILHAKVGDKVQVGSPLFTIYSSASENYKQEILGAYTFSRSKPSKSKLVLAKA